MSKTVMEYLLRMWQAWIDTGLDLWVWYHAFRRNVQYACSWTEKGWSDEEIIQCLDVIEDIPAEAARVQ